MLEKSGVRYPELSGIGIGISGVLERSTGITLFWPKLPLWVNVPVKKILEERYKTLVALEDIVRTQALAEYRFGSANSTKNFIYITIGAGTGAALFINGQLYTGADGFAGEFGHITVSEKGPLCSCGNRGCLETLVSASALIRRARQGLSLGLSNTLMQLSQGNAQSISIEMLAQAAIQGDRFATRLLLETGAHLGRAIVGLINLLNPELIVIGGGVASAAGELILPEVERVVRDRAMAQLINQVQLRMSKLQEKDWALGAALLVTDKALAQSISAWMRSKPDAAR
jgi:glucokinase